MGCWAHAERSGAEARGMELGRAGPCGRERERRRPGPVWAAGFRVWLGWVLGSFPFLFLFQTKFEFKYNLNSNHTQIIKAMHQHECNNKFLNLDKF